MIDINSNSAKMHDTF